MGADLEAVAMEEAESVIVEEAMAEVAIVEEVVVTVRFSFVNFSGTFPGLSRCLNAKS